MSAQIPFKVMTRTNGTHMEAAGLLAGEEGCWRSSGGNLKQAEITLALSAPSAVRTVTIGLSDAAYAPMVEILGGALQDEKGDFCVLATMQPIMSVASWKYAQERGKLAKDQARTVDVRCSPPAALGAKKWSRVRIVVRTFSGAVLGLESLLLSSARMKAAPPSPAGEAKPPVKEAAFKITSYFSQAQGEKRGAPSQDSSSPSTQVVPEEQEEVSEGREEAIVETRGSKQRSSGSASAAGQASHSHDMSDSEDECDPLDGVEIVISGIANPERADIREKALALGATYNANWRSCSTHLICPAPNQSKFKEAKNAGKPIVRPSWIHDCHAQQKRIPVESYELVPREGKTSSAANGKKRAGADAGQRAPTRKKAKVDYSYGGWLDEDSEGDQKPATPSVVKSASEWGLETSIPASRSKGAAKSSDGEDALEMANSEDDVEMSDVGSSGDEGASIGSEHGSSSGEEVMKDLPNVRGDLKGGGAHGPCRRALLPNFLSHCYVHFFGHFGGKALEKLRQVVIANGGHVDTFLYTNTSHVVTNGDWQARFSVIQDRQPETYFVKPEWLWACQESQSFVDPSEHLVGED